MKRFKDICDLLDSIKIQSYPNLEVIFVAERSRELLKNVESYAKGIGLSLRTVFNGGRWGLSEARNLGIKIANGDIIAFVDDDAVLAPVWSKELVETFALSDDIIGVTGHALPLFEDDSLRWLPRELHWLISCTTWYNGDGIHEVRNAWGHNMAFKREAFEMCGFFSQSTGFVLSSGDMGFIEEDLAFSMIVKAKTGKRIVYNPAVKVWHRVYPERLSLRSIIKRAALWLNSLSFFCLALIYVLVCC